METPTLIGHVAFELVRTHPQRPTHPYKLAHAPGGTAIHLLDLIGSP